MKRAIIYMKVSSLDQHPETQLHDLQTPANAVLQPPTNE